MTQISKITKEDVQAAKKERDALFAFGQKIQKDWIEFHLAVLAFKNSVVGKSFKWELAGYRHWTDFVKALCKKIGESRTVFYEKLKAVEALPPAKIRELGTKSKVFAAKRIARAGKLTPDVEEKLKNSSADGARRLARSLAKPSEEPRVLLQWLLLESQHDLVVRQTQRIMRLLGFQTKEQLIDFIFGDLLGGWSDEQIVEFHNSGQVPAKAAE